MSAGDLPTVVARLHSFVNTLDLRRFVLHGRPIQGGDRLATPAALGVWLADAGLLAGDSRVTEADLRLAHTLRAALRAATAQAGDAPASPVTPPELDRLITVSFAAGSAPTLRPSEPGVRGALAQILAEAIVAGVEGTWQRLKMCPAADCRWVFYDRSRPGNGRWCDPSRCGNRMKNRAYRARRSPGPLSDPAGYPGAGAERLLAR